MDKIGFDNIDTDQNPWDEESQWRRGKSTGPRLPGKRVQTPAVVLSLLLDLYPWKIYPHRFIGLVGRVLANDPGDLGSIPGHVIPKTLKMILDTSLLISQIKPV